MNSDIQPFYSRFTDTKETAKHLKLDEKTVGRRARKSYIPAHPLGEGKRKFWHFCELERSAWLLLNPMARINSRSLSGESAPVRVSETLKTQLGIARPPRFIKPGAVIHSRPRRCQRGPLSILKHINAPDTWAFRYYANENGRQVHKRKTIGTIIDLPRRKDAKKAVA